MAVRAAWVSGGGLDILLTFVKRRERLEYRIADEAVHLKKSWSGGDL